MRQLIDNWKDKIQKLETRIGPALDSAEEVFIDLAGLKTVRVKACDHTAMRLIGRELGWVITNPVPEPDATIYLWKENEVRDFISEVIMPDLEIPAEEEFLLFSKTHYFEQTNRTVSGADPYAATIPTGQVNFKDGTIFLADGNNYYYGTSSYEPDRWLREGHVFVQMLFRILNTLPNASLVHGACIGLHGNGLLMCARGNRGKSTLAITALLKGFEYVSEDYLILQSENGSLTASPIYSIVTLSPQMYNALYDEFDRARFVGVSSWKGKYVFNISGYSDALRRHYPVKACLFPDIDLSATKPIIEKCGSLEKNRAITHLAHSTLFQMWSTGLKQSQNDSETILKLARMITPLDFYKITLTPDIFANAECLRAFTESMNNNI